MGNKTPVDAFPPKIIARIGTTTIEIPGTPTFDIPTKMAQIANNIHCKVEKSSVVIILNQDAKVEKMNFSMKMFFDQFGINSSSKILIYLMHLK
jgi:hypothetical protein